MVREKNNLAIKRLTVMGKGLEKWSYRKMPNLRADIPTGRLAISEEDRCP